MDKIGELEKAMRGNPGNVRFADLCRICDHYFLVKPATKDQVTEYIKPHGQVIHG